MTDHKTDQKNQTLFSNSLEWPNEENMRTLELAIFGRFFHVKAEGALMVILIFLHLFLSELEVAICPLWPSSKVDCVNCWASVAPKSAKEN